MRSIGRGLVAVSGGGAFRCPGQQINLNSLGSGIHHPQFLHAGARIYLPLGTLVKTGGAGRQNFHDQIRRAFDSLFRDDRFSAAGHKNHVRLIDVDIVQENIERRNEDLAQRVFFQKSKHQRIDSAGNDLVNGPGGWRHDEVSFDDLKIGRPFRHSLIIGPRNGRRAGQQHGGTIIRTTRPVNWTGLAWRI